MLSSPFEAFARYEQDRGLPAGFLRSVNANGPDTNAWARLERSEVTAAEFDAAFAVESTALGHQVPGADVLALLIGEIRPQMVRALDNVRRRGLLAACLTNNVIGGFHREEVDAVMREEVAAVMARFDLVVESSKVGVRKPEPRFYEIACELLDVRPDECVFLDDLGVNLKPARAMGMITIKVADPDDALAELSGAVDFDVMAAA